jgi:intracellular sulfur oxidation DsrE/DsrF family protein
MTMNADRRSLARRLIAAAATGFVAFKAGETKAAAPAGSGPLKVVYHLSEMSRVTFVLGNIVNHFKGAGGPEKVQITLVIHGPALDYFRTEAAEGGVANRVAELRKAGLALVACGNTMKGSQLSVDNLIPGFTVAEEGGVTRLAQLQAEGYAYLRP